MAKTVTEPPAATPAAGPTDWEANFRNALKSAQENIATKTVGRRVLPPAWGPVWHSIVALLRAMTARPAPGKFAPVLRYVEDLLRISISTFHVAAAGDKNLAEIEDPSDVIFNRLIQIQSSLSLIDSPPAHHRETPRDLFKLPNMSAEQILRMHPHLNMQHINAMADDPLYKPPEAPPRPELAPIERLDRDQQESLERLLDLVAEEKALVEPEASEEVLDDGGYMDKTLGGLMGRV